MSLRLGNNKGKNHTTVPCAITSDFTPVLESYGYYFEPIAKTKFDKAYYDSNEYILRKQVEAYFKPFILKKAVSATVTSIRKPMIEDFPLPVPPLPVQREIVRILDNFTELTAELTARKQQYAYYRDKLLTHSSETKICKLADVCESIADGDHMPPPKADDGIPFITISNITEQNKISFSNTMFVPSSYYDALGG